MTDRLEFERVLEARLRARASLASRRFDASEIAQRAVATQPRPHSPAWRLWPEGVRPSRRAIVLFAAALLLPATIAAASIAGAWLEERRARDLAEGVPRVQLAAVERLVGAVNAR